VQAMPGMADGCGATCLSLQRWSTLTAHGWAIAYAGVALLVTNVVLVGWLVALAGGRLRVSSAGQRARRSGAPAADGGRERDVRLLLTAGLLASAAVHAAVVPAHLDAWLGAGVFFLVLTVAELTVADRLSRVRRRPALVAAVLVSVVPLGVWAVSRTAGLPVGPEAGVPEAVGLADAVVCLLEVGTLVAAVLLLRRGGGQDRPRAAAHSLALAVVAVVAVGAVGLAGAAAPWLDGVDSGGGTDVVQHHR